MIPDSTTAINTFFVDLYLQELFQFDEIYTWTNFNSWYFKKIFLKSSEREDLNTKKTNIQLSLMVNFMWTKNDKNEMKILTMNKADLLVILTEIRSYILFSKTNEIIKLEFFGNYKIIIY